MKLYYNSFDISALGEISIKQSRELLAEGQSFPDQPQRAKVRLEATVDLFLPTYDQNRAQIDSLRTALLLPNAVLRWTNDAVGVDYVNQTAVVVSEDLPEEWGQYHQTLHLVFAYYEQVPGGATNNLPLTFSKEGSATSYQFDVVNRWQHSAGTERFSTLRKQRRETRGKIHVEGQSFGDTTQPLAQRRTLLAASAAAMVEQMNSAEGVLQFGAQPGPGTGGSVFNGMVRIEEFTCDLDQLVNAINFSFTCSYTLFPDETAYATAEFTAEEQDNFTGELTLTVTGRIQAQDEASARVKLAAVFGQVLAAREYEAGQQLSLVTTPNGISANEDGDTFTELTFTGRWRKWAATNQMMTVRGTGPEALGLGNVSKWADRVDSTRFTPLRAQRERTTGVIEAGGTLAGDPTLDVVPRRAGLLALQRALKAEVASAAQITLAYGDWKQVVRVNNFTAEINQAETGIDWSLGADYILFPNLASYATAEYTVAEHDNFTGELRLAIGGRIQAQDEAAARVKLAAILAQVLATRKFAAGGQELSRETTPNIIDDDTDGATFTELTFTVEYRKWKASNQPATFGTPPMGLGNVSKWADRVTVARFDPLRPQRERAACAIEAAGTLAGDATVSLANRRAALLAQQRALKAAVNVSQGVLVYGDFSQVVRVTEFTAEINQAETGIDWNLSATYTLFPVESAYATAQYTAEQKDNFTGELVLTVSGKIQSQDEAGARVKLAAVFGQVLTDRGYLAGQQLNLVTVPNAISANADGDTFTELSFTGSWRIWKATNQMATVLADGHQDPVPLGNVTKWADRVDTTRFTPLRAQRERTTGLIEAGGTLAGDPTLTVVARRAQLLRLQRALKAEVSSSASVTLAYGDWTQVVRVNSFTAEINQAETGIDWSLAADYILFPNLASYATATYTITERDNFTGELHLAVGGRVQAQDEPSARVKLAAILQQALADRNFNKGAQILSMESAANTIDDDTDGATFTELTFSGEYRKWKKSNLMASFGTPAVGLGNVSKWQDRVSISRFNPLRSLRERASDTITAAGTLAGDATLALTDRRAALLLLQRKLKVAVNVPDGLLVYGDFSQVVRVTDFSAEINQAETGIDWSLGATYTLFPNESTYTTTEWTADQKDNFTGETTLTLAGKIQAATLALAQTKLAALTMAVALQNGYTKGAQQLTNDSTSNNLSTMDGDTFIELAFSVSWRMWKSTNQMATFKATNGGTLRGLGNVNRWRDHYAATRFNEMRSQRRHATGSVEASGTLTGDMTLTVTARRAALLALQRQLKAQVNCADGTLTYGDWSQCVRVEDFQAEINQAETGIDWSLSASYSLFPNEGGYATAEYTVNDREDVESGDETFVFNGKISAPTAALAAAKLNTLRTAVLAMYGWTLAQRLNDESTIQSVYANGDATFYPAGSGVTDATDGTTFFELSFGENYRRRIQGLLVGSTLQVSNREDIPAQTLMTTFAGTVTATGPSLGAAYAAALAQAQALGANREPAIDSTAYLRNSSVSYDQRQVTQNSALEFLRVTFSYEYQSKLSANRAYMEMTTHVNRDTFGVDVETCSGFVAARDSATAQTIYADCVRSTYDGRLIHSEQTGFSQTQNQTAAGFNEQDLRMEFNLQVYSPKLAGELGMKYSVEVTRDFLTLEMRTAMEGSCFAQDRPTADTAVAALLLALDFGASVHSRRHEDRETTQPGSGIGTTDVMMKLEFQEDFVGAVTGQAGVNEMKLTEKVVYSETRWSVQNLPFEMDGSGGVSIPQPSGVDPGNRTVSGSVTAATLATAQAWAVVQRALLTGDKLGGLYPRQEEWETDYEFVPRIDGIPKGQNANVRLYRVNFQFGEILPLYPKPA